MSERDTPPDAAAVAATLAERLDAHGQDYALGGAIALSFWALPRSTVDVDVTVYLPADQPSQCVWLLQEIGCELATAKTLESLREDGFCRVTFAGLNVDVFLPIVTFYEVARGRRKSVPLAGKSVLIWDAETLAVFKMMFFRRKDLADVRADTANTGHRIGSRDGCANGSWRCMGRAIPASPNGTAWLGKHKKNRILSLWTKYRTRRLSSSFVNSLPSASPFSTARWAR